MTPLQLPILLAARDHARGSLGLAATLVDAPTSHRPGEGDRGSRPRWEVDMPKESSASAVPARPSCRLALLGVDVPAPLAVLIMENVLHEDDGQAVHARQGGVGVRAVSAAQRVRSGGVCGAASNVALISLLARAELSDFSLRNCFSGRSAWSLSRRWRPSRRKSIGGCIGQHQ